MNIRQIEVFKAIMDTGSVTQASVRLRISQPSASKHLKLLEFGIGFPLFSRTGNKLTPTVEALAFYDQVERIYLGLDQLTRFADSLKLHSSGNISVAAMPLLAHKWLPEIIGPFLRRYEGVSMALPIRSSRWIVESVASGQIDIGVGLKQRDSTGVRQENLMSIPLVCVMPPDHELTGLQSICATDLAKQTLITLSNFDQWRLVVETALEHGARPRRRVDTFTTQAACELVERGVGVAIVDAITAFDYSSRGLAWRKFEPASVFDIALILPKRRPLSRLAEEFTSLLRQVAENTAAELAASSL